MQYVESIKKAHVLVIGDVMLDRYWCGSTDRVSPEAPVPVVNISQDESRPGGAANVALNIVALGAKATLLAHTGDDEMGFKLKTILSDKGVECVFSAHKEFQTCTKVRVLSHDQQLIRLDFEKDLSSEQAQSLLPNYAELLNDVDAVVCSDYGKGSMQVVAELIKLAKQKSVPVFVDPKSNDFADYQGASLITPNLKEFEQVVGPCADEKEITEKALQLMVKNELDALLVTRGKDGMSFFQKDKPPFHLPTQAKEVYDVTGAGDTVIATMAAAIGGGVVGEQSVHLANLAAGIVVGKVGTATASYQEVNAMLSSDQLKHSGVVSKEQCLQIRLAAKAQGKKVVMTNGCFDLLHPGHLQYLREARALGDYLIVALNSDSSIQSLKGPGRPINPLASREAMLAALEMVDCVVAFDEETPASLYAEILPDVLVKGGDYKPEEVAGGEAVIASGGCS